MYWLARALLLPTVNIYFQENIAINALVFSFKSTSFCQIPNPGQSWELTLLLHGNKNNTNKNPSHLSVWGSDSTAQLQLRKELLKKMSLHCKVEIWNKNIVADISFLCSSDICWMQNTLLNIKNAQPFERLTGISKKI
jgi:hypothetical protein